MSLPIYAQVINSTTHPVPVNLVAGGGGVASAVDVTDRTARVLGHVIIDSAGTITVSGSVSVSNFPATQPVSGTFFQATQPVSIASMPSTPVTGTFWQATQPVSGTFWQSTQPVSIASMPSTPVTGTFWQATQPVSAVSLPLPTGAALETGGNLAGIKTDLDEIALDTDNLAGIKTDTDKIPSDPAREGGILTTIDTDLKATQPRDVTDRAARLLGHVTVDSVPTTAVTLATQPLPTNASQESGGNLDFIRAMGRQHYTIASAQLQTLSVPGGFFPVEIPTIIGG